MNGRRRLPLRLALTSIGLAFVLLSPSLFGAHFGHRDHPDRSIVITQIGGS